jgi:hypothetical protein
MKASKHACVDSFTERSGDIYSVKFHPGDVSIFKNFFILFVYVL